MFIQIRTCRKMMDVAHCHMYHCSFIAPSRTKLASPSFHFLPGSLKCACLTLSHQPRPSNRLRFFLSFKSMHLCDDSLVGRIRTAKPNRKNLGSNFKKGVERTFISVTLGRNLFAAISSHRSGLQGPHSALELNRQRGLWKILPPESF